MSGVAAFTGNSREITVEDTAEPIRAWRTWRRHGNQLHSTYLGGTAWRREMEASCRCWEAYLCGRTTSMREHLELMHRPDPPRCDPPPGEWNAVVGADPLGSIGYGCGLYAVDTLDHLLDSGWAPTYDSVVGQVLLGGRVRVHQHGYRAQYAQIAGLLAEVPRRRCGCGSYHTTAVSVEQVAELAGAYGVPLLDRRGEELAA